MITFTLSVVIALLGLIGLAIGYFLGYRTGYVDGTEDAAGVEDEWVASKAGDAPYGLPSGSMVGGQVSDGFGKPWPSRDQIDQALTNAERMGWKGEASTSRERRPVQNGGHHTE